MVEKEIWTIVVATTLPSIFIGFILLYCGIVITRRTYREWNLYRFPKRVKIPLSKQNMTKYHYKKMNENLEKNTSKESQICPPETKLPKGWGEINENIVNYKNFISKGLKILEMAAIYSDETLARPLNHSAKEYIEFLKTKTSKKLQWNSFLETFEKSTFSDAEITLLEYTEFMKNFNEILKSLSS
eukprot:gene1139-10653_t